jgi:hypothetical protein
MHTAGNLFYVLLDMTNGDTMIAQYDGHTWTPLVRKFEVMPDGTELSFLQSAFAVNGRGEVVYSGYANGGKIIFRSSDGTSHLVYSEMMPTDDGDQLPGQIFEFDIRDNGEIYFVGTDSKDSYVLYRAEPLG